MAACCQEIFLISQEIFKEKQDIKNEAWEISKICTTSYPGLLRLLLSEINKRRSPGYEVETVNSTIYWNDNCDSKIEAKMAEIEARLVGMIQAPTRKIY
jgi:hypothetical protein